MVDMVPIDQKPTVITAYEQYLWSIKAYGIDASDDVLYNWSAYALSDFRNSSFLQYLSPYAYLKTLYLITLLDQKRAINPYYQLSLIYTLVQQLRSCPHLRKQYVESVRDALIDQIRESGVAIGDIIDEIIAANYLPLIIYDVFTEEGHKIVAHPDADGVFEEAYIAETMQLHDQDTSTLYEILLTATAEIVNSNSSCLPATAKDTISKQITYTIQAYKRLSDTQLPDATQKSVSRNLVLRDNLAYFVANPLAIFSQGGELIDRCIVYPVQTHTNPLILLVRSKAGSTAKKGDHMLLVVAVEHDTETVFKRFLSLKQNISGFDDTLYRMICLQLLFDYTTSGKVVTARAVDYSTDHILHMNSVLDYLARSKHCC